MHTDPPILTAARDLRYPMFVLGVPRTKRGTTKPHCAESIATQRCLARPMPRFAPRSIFARVRRAVACLAFFGVPIFCRAEPLPEFHTRTWRTDEGLPHNSVGRMLQDRTGFMWFGTPGGLARFDGREFKEFRLPAPYSARGYNIRGLAEDHTGALIVLPASGEVLRLVEGKFTLHPASKLLTDANGAPSDLFVEPGGAVWVGSFGGSLARWHPDGSAQVFGNGGMVASRTKKFSFALNKDGEAWVAADSFLAVYREGRLQPHPNTPAGPLLLAQGSGGIIWVCATEQLWKLEGHELTLVSDDVPWRGTFPTVRHVYEDQQRALWIARSRGGLLRYARGETHVVGAASTAVSYIVEDREGSLWMATDGEGVSRLRAKTHRIYDASSGLAENTVSALSEDRAGQMWLANRSGGIAFIARDGVLHPEPTGGGTRVFSNTIATDAKGAVWFGGGRSGLYRKAPGPDDTVEKMAVPETALHLLHEAKNGDMWFASDTSGLGYYRDGALTLLPPLDGLQNIGIRSMADDPSGDLWMGTQAGDLLRWDGAKIERVAQDKTYAPQPINDLLADGAGELWIATTQGLVRREGGKSYLLTENEGLADNLILQIAEDDFGRLWLAARRGLYCVSKNELRAVIRGESKRVTSRLYGRDQGLAGLTPVVNYHPRKWKARDGRLWFATSQGAVVIDPSSVARDLPPPPVLIDEVRFDGNVINHGGPTRVPSGRHRIEFRFAAPSFFSPENVQIAHRLLETDVDWVDSGSDRTASYTNLPPGAYRLRVTARHKAGEWSVETPELAFIVVPSWWETTWFQIAALAIFTGLTAWLVRAISQRVLKRRLERLEQEHALAKERARIARDLHDDLGSGLTELGLLAERIASHPSTDAARLLNGLAWRTRRLSAELSGIVWTMSGTNGRLDRLAMFIGQYAQRLFRNTGVTCVVQGIDAIPAIPIAPEPQHHLLTAAKEALNNIVKHARATQAQIAMSWSDGVFVLSIQDNGCGFNVAETVAAADGNGLRNMRTRLDEVGGTFEIESGLRHGTTLTFRLPCTGTAISPLITVSRSNV